ncbi:MAG: bifunctional glutamate N-acetyltransferase/amino-acid acetyltransferase ArgJ [Bifidobacteriaceae bacterium]|jgi:glutamate N-acetyltransferase/amino-acid N-acetyltransferase|nr:bifunctional glutamate N-acetyltransferase/amino-acid acetyltransferase ArgJ [Bifidobacteriaceae bacterium]
MSVTSPRAFRAAGVAAGIKASGALDLALVVNDGAPHLRAAAGVFTPNRFAAAPVTWCRDALGQGTPVAVVLNSGGANACTGARGDADTAATAAHVARGLAHTGLGPAQGAGGGPLRPADVLVCSTGLIGELLPMERVLAGVSAAIVGLTANGGEDAARAIMTTDTRPKLATVRGGGGAYTVGGMAKGAGMLAPALATMLVVLTTDAVVPGAALRGALERAVDQTFNRIDSDGCQSTNDTVILLASGASGHTPDPDEFAVTLTEACADLAKGLIADAEGAEHDIAITVCGATTETAAVAVARAVARSNLVKAAIYGRDPNWGRILSEVGTVPPEVAPFDPAAIDLAINGVPLVTAGAPDADRAEVNLGDRQVSIRLDLHAGPAHATVLTNDLTHAYVEENSAYST